MASDEGLSRDESRQMRDIGRQAMSQVVGVALKQAVSHDLLRTFAVVSKVNGDGTVDLECGSEETPMPLNGVRLTLGCSTVEVGDTVVVDTYDHSPLVVSVLYSNASSGHTVASKPEVNAANSAADQALSEAKTAKAKADAATASAATAQSKAEDAGNAATKAQSDIDQFKKDAEATYSTKTEVDEKTGAISKTIEANYTKTADLGNTAAVKDAKAAGTAAQNALDAYKGTVSETYAEKTELTEAVNQLSSTMSSNYTAFTDYRKTNDAALSKAQTDATDAKSTIDSYKQSNDQAVADAKAAGTTAQDQLNSYKSSNDAAVADAKAAGTTAQSNLNSYKTATDQRLDELRNIADNAIESFYLEGAPTASNPPASSWTTDALKRQHAGDLYMDTDTGYSYRWSGTEWVPVKDSDVTKALKEIESVKTDYATKSELKATDTELSGKVSDALTIAKSYTDGSVAKEATARDAAIKASADSISLDVSRTYTKSDTFSAYQSNADSRIATANSNASTAVSTAKTAASDAATAKTNASSAVSTANSASTSAANAVKTANAASSSAASAVQTANSASSTASAAKSTADAASGTASTAKSTADTAKSTADSAKAAAGNAQSTANAAVSDAAKAQSSADAAQSTADDAWSRTLRVQVESAPADAAGDTSTLTATVWRGGERLTEQDVAMMGLVAWYVAGKRVATGYTYSCSAGTAAECRVEA